MDRTPYLIALCLTLTVVQLSVPAHAEKASVHEAKEHFQAGALAYKLGNYGQAVEEYKRSYALSAAPLLLYNLGQAYWKLGRFDLALHSYQQFLTDAPASSSYRSDAEQHAKELRRLLQNKDSWAGAMAQAPSTAPVPPSITIVNQTPAPPPNRTPPLAAGIALSALALASFAASVPLVLNGNDLHQQAVAATSIDRRDQLANQASTYHSAGWAMIGIGGVAAVGSAVAWAFFGMSRRRIALVPESAGASLVVGGRW